MTKSAWHRRRIFSGSQPEFIANYLVTRVRAGQGCKAACLSGQVFCSRIVLLKKSSSGVQSVTRLAEVSVVELKRCPRCEESLPLSEFGVCRARKDGLNLYCKRCIRQKIAQSRQALREYKNARIKHGSSVEPAGSQLTIDPKSGFSPRRIARMLRKLSPADRVR